MDYEQYQAALEKVDQFMKCQELDFMEETLMDSLVDKIEAYEEVHYPQIPASPQQVMRLIMEERGLKQKDLIPLFGSAPRVSEFFSGKLPTVETIVSLSKAFNLSLEIFLNEHTVKVREL